MSEPAKAKEWDEVRTAFATSIMVDTSISSLAQNLDGPDWPIKGKDETPARYIDLDYEAAVELLALKNQPASRLDELMIILRDTLSFDDPFGEMVSQTAAAADRDNPLLKNLEKLGIPANYPISHSALSKDTLEFCKLENLSTLEEFAVFAQRMSQNVIVGGDFRTLLNALSHVDEREIARFLPFRPGSKGLHLIEAAAHVIRALPAAERAQLARKGAELPPFLQAAIDNRVKTLSADAAHLKQQIAGGAELSRMVHVLDDPAIEPVVVRVLAPHVAAEPQEAADSSKGGLFGSLSRWLKK